MHCGGQVWPPAECRNQKMSHCDVQSQLSAYHDGELDCESADVVQAHLKICAPCRRELAELDKITRLFAGKRQTQMLPLELARLHLNLSPSAQQSSGELAETEFLRTAKMLSALAASILIISFVWLTEIPSRHAAALSPGVAVVPASDLRPSALKALPDWEQTALTLNVEPSSLPQVPGAGNDRPPNSLGVADARLGAGGGDNSPDAQLADWMIAGLNGSSGGGKMGN
jgi:hypothetical protein